MKRKEPELWGVMYRVTSRRRWVVYDIDYYSRSSLDHLRHHLIYENDYDPENVKVFRAVVEE